MRNCSPTYVIYRATDENREPLCVAINFDDLCYHRDDDPNISERYGPEGYLRDGATGLHKVGEIQIVGDLQHLPNSFTWNPLFG